MILSGALPAALLALAVDWALGKVEGMVTVLTSLSPRR
jgi:ABC-type proline/glycine betaine transport system permease subunit